MSKSATLTFGMDLSDFNKAMSAINRQATSFSDQLEKSIQAPMAALKKGIEQIKINPFDLEKNELIQSKIKNLTSDIKKAMTHKLNLDIEEAKKNISGLKEEIIATVGSMAVLSKPISAAIDFEGSMADVKKVVDFTGEEDIKNFSSEIMKMSRTIPLSVSELAQITASGGQLGIHKKDLLNFTETAAKMGVAFDMSAGEAGDNMAKLMNIFSMEKVGQVAALGDTINHISNNTAAKASDIVNSIGRIAGNAKDFGLSADATAGLASAFLALGKTPEVASTAINSMLTVLNNADTASGDLAEAFKKIGIDGKDLKQAILKNPQQALSRFLHTLSTIPKAQKTGILTSIFGKNFGDDISLVTGAIDNFDRAMKYSGDKKKVGSMESEFKARSETTENNLQLMKNAFNEIGVNIGSVFLPILNKAIDVIKWISYQISSLAETFPGLIKFGFGAAAAITALKAAFIAKQIAISGAVLMGGEFRKILMNLPIDCLRAGGALNTCSLSFKNFGFSMAGAKLQAGLLFNTLLLKIKAVGIAMLTNPIGIIAMSIATAAFLIYKYWQPVKAFFSGIWQGLKEGLSPLIESISAVFTPIIKIISAVFEPLKPIFSSIKSFFSSLFSQSESTKESLQGFESAGKAVGNAIAGVISLISTPLKWIMDSIKWVFDKISNSAIGKWLGEKMGINLKGADKIESSENIINPTKSQPNQNPIPVQTTQGTIDKVVQDRQAAISNQNTKTITDNKKIDINLYGSQTTPQDVALAISENSYSFGD